MRIVRNNGRLLVAAAVAVVAVLALTDPALAASPPAEGAQGEDKLAFLGLQRYDLGIYTLVVFGLLMFVLSKFAWPHIAEGLKKREAVILGAREEAQKDRQAAEELRAKLQKDYAEAHDKIRGLLDEARRDADAVRAQAKEDADREKMVERERTRREFQAEADTIRQELYQQAVQLATMLSAKTIRRQLSADDHSRLLDEALAELKGSVRHA